ncbi:HEAT repeat domain-containing protein [Hymenobacter sp. DH14]|uniref:HEAT repeat domain-containing protein n=1 Tax=Hymenobacter cyanobacteriorum TaxID=2926463 RepID=A0A9X2AI00_9BACT|nr:HEAT repeat domain-containing protein [Hymenobacter cyanobacteriorum]MCI1189443.1 HEAT repeat domain-containing protein [Hymenobacter cyanobacteriorum]
MKLSEFSTCSELESLLPAYAESSLPTAEAERVVAHLPGCPACQQQLRELRALSADFDAALPEVPGTALRHNFMAMLEQQKQQLKPEAAFGGPAAPVAEQPAAKVISMWPTALASNWVRIAASIVLVAAGVFLGRQLPWSSQPGNTVATTAPATGQAAPATLAAALSGDSGHAVSASSRIALVTNSTKTAEPDDATVQVLLNTLNFDPNPNVRLAACEALYRLRDAPGVREGLANSLPIQTDPNVQIALIDMVVSLRVHRAVPQLQRLAKRPDALPVVRAQAEAGIGKLI